MGSLLNEKAEEPQRGTGTQWVFWGDRRGFAPHLTCGASPGDGSPAGIDCGQVEGAPWGFFGL